MPEKTNETSQSSTIENTELPGTKAGSSEIVVSGGQNALQQKAADAMKRAENDECNAFEAVRLMLDGMNASLGEAREFGSLPRYVRIARVGEGELTLSTRPIGVAVAAVTGGFLTAIGFVAEMTLKAIDLLKDIDGGVALIEVGADMLKTLCSDAFTDSLQRSVGIDKPVPNPMGEGVTSAVERFEKVLKYVPSPEDVEGVSKALYRLLAVEQLAAPVEKVNVDIAATGKIRLMSWALEKPIPVFAGSGIVDFSSPTKVTYLGSRILSNIDTPPEIAELVWTSEDKSRSQLVYSCNFSEIGSQGGGAGSKGSEDAGGGDSKVDDLTEASALLTALGYQKANLRENFVDFQRVNELEKEGGAADGTLDIVTLSRLLNLDYKNKQLKRAKRFEAETQDKGPA